MQNVTFWFKIDAVDSYSFNDAWIPSLPKNDISESTSERESIWAGLNLTIKQEKILRIYFKREKTNTFILTKNLSIYIRKDNLCPTSRRYFNTDNFEKHQVKHFGKTLSRNNKKKPWCEKQLKRPYPYIIQKCYNLQCQRIYTVQYEIIHLTPTTPVLLTSVPSFSSR